MIFETGQVFWSTKPSCESENNFDSTPIKPWQGKILLTPRGNSICIYLHRYDQKTGEIDEDQNAYAYCGTTDKPEKLFFARENAVKSYFKETIHHIKMELLDLVTFAEEIERFQATEES